MTTLAASLRSAPAPMEAPEVLDSLAVARLLRVHLTTVQELARRGHLPGRKVGKDYRFLKAAIVAWLSEEEVQTVANGRVRR